MKYIIAALFVSALIVSGCSSSKSDNNLNQIILKEKQNLKIDTIGFSEKAKSHLIDGNLLSMQNDYAGAILEYQEALSYDSSSAIMFMIANNFFELGKIKRAKRYLINSIERNEIFVHSYDLLSDIYFYTGEVKKASELLEKAIEIEASDERKFKLAFILENINYDRAIKIYNSISDPAVKERVMNRKLYLYRSKRFKDQNKYISALKELYNENPQNQSIAKELFSFYLENNQIDSAESFLDVVDSRYSIEDQKMYYSYMTSYFMRNNRNIDTTSVVKLISRIEESSLLDGELLLNAGFLSDYIGNKNKAKNFFLKSLKISEDINDLYISIPQYYMSNNNDSTAMMFIDTMHSYNYSHPLLNVYKGAIHFERNEFNEAIDSYKNIDRRSSDTLKMVYSFIGDSYYALKEYDSAEVYYEKHYKVDSSNDYLLNNYAWLLVEKENGNLDKAEKLSLLSLDLNPENSSYLDTYGWILYKKGQYKEALINVLKAVEYGGASAVVYHHLGDIYKKLGKKEKAIESYELALELNPENPQEIKDKLDSIQ